MYLLDTNTLIYYFKGLGRVAERLLSTRPANVGISTITLSEIDVGLEKSRAVKKRRKLLSELQAVVRIVAFERRAARSAAHIRAVLEAAGTPIGPLDSLIAGTAVASRATLVTHNIEEFSRVPDLTLVDWY